MKAPHGHPCGKEADKDQYHQGNSPVSAPPSLPLPTPLPGPLLPPFLRQIGLIVRIIGEGRILISGRRLRWKSGLPFLRMLSFGHLPLLSFHGNQRYHSTGSNLLYSRTCERTGEWKNAGHRKNWQKSCRDCGFASLAICRNYWKYFRTPCELFRFFLKFLCLHIFYTFLRYHKEHGQDLPPL